MSDAITDGATGPMDERLTFSVDQVARLLGISRSGAYDSIARGEIPSLNIGRRVLVPREPFMQLIRSARWRRRPDDPRARGRL
jgi:excisionase family DNA binding protein